MTDNELLTYERMCAHLRETKQLAVYSEVYLADVGSLIEAVRLLKGRVAELHRHLHGAEPRDA